MYLVNKDY